MKTMNEKDAQLQFADRELDVFKHNPSNQKGCNSMHDKVMPINGSLINVSLYFSDSMVQELRKVLVKLMELARIALWVGPTYHLMTTP